jgi:hypothetical protein
MCTECHQKDVDSGVCIENHFFRSYGKCELCGKVTDCVDCKAYKYKEPTNGEARAKQSSRELSL